MEIFIMAEVQILARLFGSELAAGHVKRLEEFLNQFYHDPLRPFEKGHLA